MIEEAAAAGPSSFSAKMANHRLNRAKKREEKMQKKIAKHGVIERLTEMQLNEFHEAFKVFDVDGGGSIDATELSKLMASVGQVPTDEELAEMIRIADADGSGEVDFYEFVALMAHKMADPANHEAVSEAFGMFDTTGDGKIDADEIAAVMMNVGEPCTWEVRACPSPSASCSACVQRRALLAHHGASRTHILSCCAGVSTQYYSCCDACAAAHTTAAGYSIATPKY